MIEIKTNKIAGGGVCSALCISFLLASSFIPIKIALLFASSIVMGICIIRYKTMTALLSYLTVSLISILILPKTNLIISLAFAVLFGIYPIFKLYIEKIQNITIEYIVKFCVWHIHLFGMYVVLSAFGQNSLFDLGTVWIWMAGIAIMLTYDLAFGIFINSLYRTYHKFLN